MEQSWRKWLNSAVDSLDAALLLEQHGHVRSSASRGYYAAYQAATAFLLYSGRTPPDGREGWGHEATPDLLRKLFGVPWKQDKKNDLSVRLADLYKLRIIADYKFGIDMNEADLRSGLKSASYTVRIIGAVLVTGK